MLNQALRSPIDAETTPRFSLKILEEGDGQMVKCPTCGKEIETPIKWNMDRNKKIHVKQYEYCGKGSVNIERRFSSCVCFSVVSSSALPKVLSTPACC